MGPGAPGDGGHGKHGGHGGPLALDTVATVIGIEADALRDALRDGQTLAEVAAANGVEAETLIDALVAEANERIDAAVAMAVSTRPTPKSAARTSPSGSPSSSTRVGRCAAADRQGRCDDAAVTADEIIERLALEPHPEGGHYRQTWRDEPTGDGRASARPSTSCFAPVSARRGTGSTPTSCGISMPARS